MKIERNLWPLDRTGTAMFVLGLAFALCALFLLGAPAPVDSPERTALEDADAVDRPAGAIRPPADLDGRKVRLGRRLFHDTRLSGNGSRSCASCHDLASNGSSRGERETPLDTPTLFNVALNYRFGWTGAFRTLEEQALATLESPLMTRGAPPEIAYRRIAADRALAREFEAIYGQGPRRTTIADALAEFERSLVTPSRFDRWLEGDAAALTARERRGYDAFVRLGCASCHQGRNLGGNLMQRHGIFRPLASPRPAVVRVPGLRNVAETAPYFHDGSAATLQEAIRKMAAAQLNRDLSSEEIGLLAAFLGALTGTYEGTPVRR